jgi:uncharacterized protein
MTERLSSPVPAWYCSVAALWRYPVKSMMGEELNATRVTSRGVLGDRQFAVVDPVTGKVAGAKNPRKWGNFFDFRAAYVEPPQEGAKLPAVRVMLPDGQAVTSDEPGMGQALSEALGRKVTLVGLHDAGAPANATAEAYELDTDTVTDFGLPTGTFFDSAIVHVLTTATLDRLRMLYPQGRFESRRFRPNIVVSADPELGFVENDWVGRTIAIGDQVRLRVTGPCGRCVMITLPQGDLPKDAGILRAAAQHNGAHVGVYAGVLAGGAIRRGDRVTVT